MATERQSPDSVADSTNYQSAALGSIQDDPDSPDSKWWGWDGNGNTICRVTFPTPTGQPTSGVNQEFRVQIRDTTAGTQATGWALQLYNGAVAVTALATGTSPDSGGVVVNGLWDANTAITADGSAIECRLEQTVGGTGGPTARRGIEVGAAEWNVEFDVGGSTFEDKIIATEILGDTETEVLLAATKTTNTMTQGEKLAINTVMSVTITGPKKN
jgi:hypothetical protein